MRKEVFFLENKLLAENSVEGKAGPRDIAGILSDKFIKRRPQKKSKVGASTDGPSATNTKLRKIILLRLKINCFG